VVYFHAKGGCGISVGHTQYTNASLLRVLGVHGFERNRETIWKRSTHICFDGHKSFGNKRASGEGGGNGGDRGLSKARMRLELVDKLCACGEG